MKQQPECMCGCGKRAYHNQMVIVEAEEAIDKDIRKTGTVKKFWVRKECRQAFEHELALQIMLQKLIRVWYNKPFWKRIWVARNVLKMQHAIWERNRGFEYARKRATRSAILFGCPRFLQEVLARRFVKNEKKAMQQVRPLEAAQ